MQELYQLNTRRNILANERDSKQGLEGWGGGGGGGGGGGEGPVLAFPLLFYENLAFHFFFPLSCIPCPISANPASQEHSNSESRTPF